MKMRNKQSSKTNPKQRKSEIPRKQQPQTTARAERSQKRRKETAKDIADYVKESHEDAKEDEKETLEQHCEE